MRVHVAGNVCIDTTFRLDRFPVAGETLNASAYSDGLGGKGANQALATARTGAAVMLWAAIGNDVDSARIRAMLHNDVDTSRLTRLDLPSDRSTIVVDAAGENFIVSGVSCAMAFDPLAMTDMEASINPGDLFVMQGNLRPAVTNDCLAAAKNKGARTIFNPSPLSNGLVPELGQVDYVVVNCGEAELITGFAEPNLAAAELLDRGAGSAIVTLGSEGCLLLERGATNPLTIAAPKVSTVDTSGAGDVFCGVFAGCLARKLSPVAALRIAVAASAISVTRPGTLQSCPTRAEIAALIQDIELEST
jgi:ribokinase